MTSKNDSKSEASKPATLDDGSLDAVRGAAASSRESPLSDAEILEQKLKAAEELSYRGRPTRNVPGQTK